MLSWKLCVVYMFIMHCAQNIKIVWYLLRLKKQLSIQRRVWSIRRFRIVNLSPPPRLRCLDGEGCCQFVQNRITFRQNKSANASEVCACGHLLTCWNRSLIGLRCLVEDVWRIFLQCDFIKSLTKVAAQQGQQGSKKFAIHTGMTELCL